MQVLKARNFNMLWASSGGGSGIRTHGTLLTYTRFPSVRLKPLGHPSDSGAAKYQPHPAAQALPRPHTSIFNAARNALCGISTLPN